MANKEENYFQKSQNIFNLLNQFRANPRKLAHHLEKLKKYLDKSTNILSEPNKVQIQMIEGEKIFDETIKYLKSLSPLRPLDWDDSLALSAQEHVDDIGPKGLLLYQSSDGTDPEDRIGKYGKYVESLGENIDFGPNDEIGVIVSLTLDDGEVERPHRDNMFKNDFRKIGIACGPHKTEYQMCVMDMAYDFSPIYHPNDNNNIKSDLNNEVNNNIDNIIDININDNINNNINNNIANSINTNIKNNLSNSINTNINNNIDNNKRGNIMDNNKDNIINNNKDNIIDNNKDNIIDNNIENNNNSNEIIVQNNDNSDYNNKLFLKNININEISPDEEEKKITIEIKNQNNIDQINKINLSEIDQLKQKVKNINSTKKIIKKSIEITTKVTYIYEDGSTRDVNQVRIHITNS
jgi:uncharacterized protein YkwD